ncbi:conserved hypothetical protein [Verticillium alfalfae VaMs.102]|uniref:Uncharacterized protein n=1 Tax=Verticillium alfalfae (strain VaMs.102 / ATCC MYA-4576 / FGSC 10136) TaxID=526221 RepID=C9SJV4_VERA1|nr:conserved hypothetical protein [Verticillium alfalfae VaMs.102]EEY19718.1 conserved hypothetical protein [Verticillium alfalfae VaMs.102]
MKIFAFLHSALLMAIAVTASPVTRTRSGETLLEKRQDRGLYSVSGLGARKQAILNAGGNSLDLAIAMLETERMSTDYIYGDNKSNDAANFGLFKQNWGMLRICASRASFVGQSQSQWNNGARLKYDKNLAQTNENLLNED